VYLKFGEWLKKAVKALKKSKSGIIKTKNKSAEKFC